MSPVYKETMQCDHSFILLHSAESPLENKKKWNKAKLRQCIHIFEDCSFIDFCQKTLFTYIYTCLRTVFQSEK